MAGINQLLANLDSVNIKEIVEDSLVDLAPDLVAAQKDQLKRGRLSTGEKTGKYKLEAYAIKKHMMNPLAGYGYKDYRLTGDLWQGIFVDVRQTSIVFASSDSKFQTVLDNNDGDNIMGLSDFTIGKEIEPKMRAVVVPKIVNKILR